jgi:metal-dependent amidase/aminoacylase/carboxypeptidase family protein
MEHWGDFYTRQDGRLATSKIDATFNGKAAHAGGIPMEAKSLLAAATAVIIYMPFLVTNAVRPA